MTATARAGSILEDARLNPAQHAAAEHVDGPLLVLAGAGSGKTRVLTVRTAHLIQEHGVRPENILALTFTNKAAGEMRERIHALLGTPPRGLWVGTFHAFGAWLLRQHADQLGRPKRFSIFGPDDSVQAIKRAIARLNLPEEKIDANAVQWTISKAKNAEVTPYMLLEKAEEEDDAMLTHAARIFTVYEQELLAAKAFDLDDLILRPVEMLRGHPELARLYQDRFRYILVDEYQDTNPVQYAMVEILAREHRNLMVVGDDDQAIYGWRGADIQNILLFETNFPGARVIRLEQNYRSTGRILDAANAVIRNNAQRKGKTLRTDSAAGAPITIAAFARDYDEADWIARRIGVLHSNGRSLRDFAVLYRTNAQSRLIEEALRRAGTPYQVIGGLTFYERREIKDLLAYLRLIANPADRNAFARAVNTPRRGIGKTSQQRILEYAEAEGVSVIEAALEADQIEGLPARARKQAHAFGDLIQRYSARATLLPAADLLSQLVQEVSFAQSLSEEKDGADRVENVESLVAGAASFDPTALEEMLGDATRDLTDLDLFLQHVALVTDQDRHDSESDVVTLMTLHASKGLEFPVVFLPGLEHNLFPHVRSVGDAEALQEERRLCYVGITRAEEELYVSWAASRRRGAMIEVMERSQFLDEIPAVVTECITPAGDVRPDAFRQDSRRRWAAARRPDHYERESEFEDQDAPRFIRGESVYHPHFGAGRIVDLVGIGTEIRVAVDFGPLGVRRFRARDSGLRRGFGDEAA